MLAAAVLAWMGVLCVCDVRQRRLPNWLTLPGAGVILLFAGLAGRGVPALAGAAALAGVYLLVHLALPAAMGAGDVKLAIGLGGLTGCFGVEVWFLAGAGRAAADRGVRRDGDAMGCPHPAARAVDVCGQPGGGGVGAAGLRLARYQCRPEVV